ncbi:MAG: M1 family metallopeptidase, partial [Oligoflexales bacterium]|nr:M1 family metallopeptidase [Oligoflexales bacterium]
QWLSPSQTSGGVQPFLFTQCQAIHARSVIPLQDTPCVRFRFSAEITIPAGLKALMAASSTGRSESGQKAVETFEMPQAIPSYLFAFAVGDLASRELGPRSRVWAEPQMLDAAAYEFAKVDDMLRKAEQLLGPYEWDRFDLLTMPPSFPYGGMENPRLTFLTPTLLAGDRSLANVLTHELAHSWTGNLVTNATNEHFWLNEGFTVYAERLIEEALEGAEVSELHMALGHRRLKSAIEGFSDRPELTKLRTHLSGIDPDEAFSEVPYEKGFLFLRAIEEHAGRKKFLDFLKAYIRHFRFSSITTEEFVDFTEKELPGALSGVQAQKWIDGIGIPENCPQPRSKRLKTILDTGSSVPEFNIGSAWMPCEWALYLGNLPASTPLSACEELERRFQLTSTNNCEILVSWLTVAINSGYLKVLDRCKEVLGKVGRMKYLKPLYTALASRSETRDLARELFSKNRAGYHPIAQQVVENLLRKYQA